MSEFAIIPLADCVRGDIYRVFHPDLVIGVHDGQGGFIGLAGEFARTMLVSLAHVEAGGTARPVERIGYTRLPLIAATGAGLSREERRDARRLVHRLQGVEREQARWVARCRAPWLFGACQRCGHLLVDHRPPAGLGGGRICTLCRCRRERGDGTPDYPKGPTR